MMTRRPHHAHPTSARRQTELLLMFFMLCLTGQSLIADSDQPSKPVEVLVEVGTLVYSQSGKTSECFSSGYLDLLARETNIKTNREPFPVEASSEDLFKYPFVIMSGEKDFVLQESELINLRAYIESGGFVLASSGCSNRTWAKAFRREFARIFPNRTLEKLTTEHEIFHTVFDINDIQTKKRVDSVELFALQLNGRIGLVFSPQGLNDTGNAGGSCCCCGGNEIRNAKYLNANMLAYALLK